MRTTKSAALIIAGSLALLIGGGTATAAWGGPSRDSLTPSVFGLARGHVVVLDDLSPLTGVGPLVDAVRPVSESPSLFTADVRRELHGATVSTPRTWTADERRALHGMTADAASGAERQGQRLAAYAESMQQHADSDGGADDDLSPLRSGR
ncbi:hypothetical protein [Agromyces sp. SYSU T0242]|uniref:hypothetical protein n=1 Tax=Agromyces litoreus TaxID=3158561 RepID=UPI0033984D22